MMILPSPGVLDRLISDRQDSLRLAAPPRTAEQPRLRVRVGHALIAAGASLSGECVETTARRRPAHPRAA